MKYFTLLILLFTVACSQSDKAVQEEDFSVTVKTVDETTLEANTEIELITGITNLSGTSVEVLHAAPLIHVQIYDEENKPQIDSFVTNTIDISHKIKPKEFYNPDSKINDDENKKISIEKPGKYTLIGKASFAIEIDGERKEYLISSEPYEITVE
ncbi:hypothetical protein [Paenibacillus algicola]|uniref:hypothetical protein n=1 Tax=Paenibacillus algicola TaxID=2565926 RepID=UPI0010FF5208|nr:hypothetical protein [Paenibacillus algicola]